MFSRIKSCIKFCIILCVLFFMGCLSSVSNLHVQDRIPHKLNKGFVQIVSEVDHPGLDGLPYFVEYIVLKKEFDYDLGVTSAHISNRSVPFSDGIGKQKYLIRVPVKIIASSRESSGSHSAKPFFRSTMGLTGLLIQKVDDASSQVVWEPRIKADPDACRLKPNQNAIIIFDDILVQANVSNMLLTPINVKFKVSRKTDNGIDTYSFGTVSISVEAPKPIEFAENFSPDDLLASPKIYNQDFDIVFDKFKAASRKIGYEIDFESKEIGMMEIKKSRFSGNPIIFTIGFFRSSQGKTQISISSKPFWQGWGSYNANLSYEEITKLLKAADRLILN